ncbi:MAG: hypothetical protein ACOX1A_06140 [Saccharofermentanales bacterium]
MLLHRAGKSFNRRIRHAWELLMITIGRKLPVYSHSAETARLIFEMRSYDAHMAKSVCRGGRTCGGFVLRAINQRRVGRGQIRHGRHGESGDREEYRSLGHSGR